ncbi:hypothetical protein H9639_13705 [Arthrobacter sp. Sa2CUA1]|uniref:Uncharacterized protein n=1 Tax=Arthrobacter gallicola TaxID=2762225 RepID=A0ABR8UUW0_9MICC|nr:hypothetical protein [Arthrobacter gallicola]MBD7996355.1 hypothetical protein [Arthrobacter gallicola]
MSARFPSFAEAWSMRAQRLGNRATRSWAAVCAAVALAAFLISTLIVLSDAILWPGADLVRLVASVFVGPLGLAFSVIVLWQQSGRMAAPAAFFTAVSTVPALGLATVAAASWSTGFTDAGPQTGWFSGAWSPLAAAAWTAGTVSLIAPVRALWNPPESVYARGAKTTLLAALAALSLGVLYLTAFLLAPLAAAALLAVSLRASGSATTDAASAESASAGPVRPGAPLPYQAATAARRTGPAAPRHLPPSRRLRTAVAGIGLATLFLGVGCAVFALTGSRWPELAADSTAAMNLGLAAGALNAIPVAVAVGFVLHRRFGRVIVWSTLLVCGSLLVEAAAQAAGAGHPSQWPLTVFAGVLFGFALALPCARLVPGPALQRFCVVVGAGLAAAFIGLNAVAAAGFIAPFMSLGLLAWSFSSPPRRSPVSQPA